MLHLHLKFLFVCFIRGKAIKGGEQASKYYSATRNANLSIHCKQSIRSSSPHCMDNHYNMDNDP